MNKINWKVRFKNPQFIAQIAISIFVPILGYAGLTAQDLTSWAILLDLIIDAISNPYVLMIVAVSVYNAIQDPTTAGIGDSRQALTYNKPKGE
ncbi:hypothetical protein B795N_00280 [Marinilactibacillus psychrotolerans]|uniref:phage holin n=1 Tax=Marinilactibacillus psychrotolerans TaxID=191770 RepID=UPI001C7DB8F6|nr:phage holin [Marinilactibacillus psychrotolerans]GEQ32146.1 hypothetical protein B795N_00280 [Marinilactibacillus psychrotolerans]